MAILWPVFLASTTSRTILSPPKPSMISAIDVAAAAAVCQCESRGEAIQGQIWVIDALRNRAEKDGVSIVAASFIGICRGKIKPEFIKLASEVLKQPPSHSFTYFLNAQTATDRKWVEFGLSQQGTTIGAHWFFGNISSNSIP